MKTPLKGLSSKQLGDFLCSYKGTQLQHFKLPIFYSIKGQGENKCLQRQFVYKDFKEAFPHYVLLGKSCQQLNYFPQLFNVYNKIVVRCYTEEASKEIITTKDLFMAFLINEMSGNQSELAYKRALEEFNNAV